MLLEAGNEGSVAAQTSSDQRRRRTPDRTPYVAGEAMRSPVAAGARGPGRTSRRARPPAKIRAPAASRAGTAGPSTGQRAVPTRRPRPSLDLILTGALCSAALWQGWRMRDEYLLVADSGLGYALGIAGLGMMVLLLLYPVRKRARFLRNAGDLRRWFHVHMALGLVGPTAILLHANFQLGSSNATAALMSMLLVAGSGIVGRVIYTRVHSKYLGHRATLRALRAGAEEGQGGLGSLLDLAPELEVLIAEFEARLLVPANGPLQGARRFLSAGREAAALRRSAWRIVRAALRAERRARVGRAPLLRRRDARRALVGYVRAVKREVRLSAYARAFSIWHVLHLPLCVLLYAAAAVHVVAVHMF